MVCGMQSKSNTNGQRQNDRRHEKVQLVPTLPVMLPPLPLLLPELPPYGKRHKRHETKQRNNKHARRDER